jgi:transcriptional regulator with XRE-family HTH domain
MIGMSDESVAERLIAVIREQSGLSQAELARRAGFTPSVLSAYARGRRQPGVDALARVATAAGLEIRIGSGDGVRGPAVAIVPDGKASGARQTRAAERMGRTRAAWARGAAEGKQLDRVRALRLSPQERIEEGLALTRIAARLQAGRSTP